MTNSKPVKVSCPWCDWTDSWGMGDGSAEESLSHHKSSCKSKPTDNSKPLPLVSLPGLMVWADYEGDGRTVLISNYGWSMVAQPTALYGELIREQSRRDAADRMKARELDDRLEAEAEACRQETYSEAKGKL